MRRPGIDYNRAIDHVSNLTKSQVDDYAAKSAAALGFGIGSDIDQLIARMGGRIHYQDIFESLGDDDTICVHGPKDFDIILSSISSPRRGRFTVAHELGHYLLHSRQGEIPLVAARAGEDNRAEWEANWFAAGFLMPAEEFRAAHADGARAFELANIFMVSEAAATVRMKSLGLPA